MLSFGNRNDYKISMVKTVPVLDLSPHIKNLAYMAVQVEKRDFHQFFYFSLQ